MGKINSFMLKKYIYYFMVCLSCCLPNYTYSQAGTINVKDFGALGDGKTNDTKAIQKAISQGAKEGKKVVFSKGVYLVDELTISTSLEGIDNVTIQRVPSKAHRHYDFCVVAKQNNILIKNITFDANSSKNNTFSNQGIPLFVYLSEEIRIEKCKFLNSSMSGLRVESSSKITIDHSEAINSSGNSGDGYYFTRSTNITVRNSTATKYTRIGFVVEDNSSEITFDNCKASYGTDASILSGGTEFNAGFWYENSKNVYTTNCIAKNNTHRGFYALSARNGTGSAEFFFDNCISEDNPVGFALASRRDISVNVRVTNSKSINVDRGFVATARNLDDKFEFDNCEVYMQKIPSGSLNNVAFMWDSPIAQNNEQYKKLPTFIYSNSRIIYDKNEQVGILKNPKANNGDISTHVGGRANIIIKNVTNSLTQSEIILKARRGKPEYFYK